MVETSTSPTILLFARGVLALFDLWPALTIAVKEEWGGSESLEKKIWIVSVIVDEFESGAVYLPIATPSDPAFISPTSPSTTSITTQVSAIPQIAKTPPLDQDQLIDLLTQIMSDEFEASIDDGSIELIARDIVRLWNDILVSSPVGAEDVVSALERRAVDVQGRVVARCGGGVEEGGDSGSEEGMDVDGDDETDGEDGEVVDGEEAPQLVERTERGKGKGEAEIDDDGFTIVKGRRGGR